MSLDARHVTVDDVAVRLDSSARIGRLRTLTLRNTGGNAAFLGGSDVTTGTGLTLPDAETMTVILRASHQLYTIAATLASTVIEVMEQK